MLEPLLPIVARLSYPASSSLSSCAVVVVAVAVVVSVERLGSRVDVAASVCVDVAVGGRCVR